MLGHPPRPGAARVHARADGRTASRRSSVASTRAGLPRSATSRRTSRSAELRRSGSTYDFARTGGYLRHCLARREEDLDGPAPEARTHEHGSSVIEAMETGVPAAINGNVPNQRLIENLPDGRCVEVPCLVDAGGVRPTVVGRLPAQLGALNRTNVNVQELIVEAALTGSTDAVRHAVALDPLTAAVCTLPEVERMTGEMLAAQERWLPQF